MSPGSGSNTLQDILEDICSNASIPSVPIVAANVLQLCNDPNIDFGQLTSMISADPAMVAKLLKMANSAAFGSHTKISSLKNSLVRMGIKVTRVAVLGFALESEIGQKVPEEFDIERFWRHSLTTATAARIIAESKCPDKRDEAFAAAILQDMGLIAFQFAMPQKYEEVFAERKRIGADLHYVEKKVLGVTHLDVGARLLQKWGLPAEVYEPIRYHHFLDKAVRDGASDDTIQVVRLLFFSTLVTRLFNYTDKNRTREAAILIAEEELGLSVDALDGILARVEEGVRQTCDLFSVDPRTIPSYEQIRIQAATQVATLGAMLGAEAQQARAQAAEQAEELDSLKAETDHLKELAAVDELTGLNNRREFMKRFEEELVRAQRHGHGIGFLILDIDRFKSVNDTYGHPVGDMVLRALGAHLAAFMRQSDIPARWGGEEFVVLLPESESLEGVTTAGEKLRASIEAASPGWVKELEGIAVSIGAAYALPSSDHFKAEPLVEEADKCLYAAKEGGRNRVCSVEV